MEDGCLEGTASGHCDKELLPYYGRAFHHTGDYEQYRPSHSASPCLGPIWVDQSQDSATPPTPRRQRGREPFKLLDCVHIIISLKLIYL